MNSLRLGMLKTLVVVGMVAAMSAVPVGAVGAQDDPIITIDAPQPGSVETWEVFVSGTASGVADDATVELYVQNLDTGLWLIGDYKPGFTPTVFPAATDPSGGQIYWGTADALHPLPGAYRLHAVVSDGAAASRASVEFTSEYDTTYTQTRVDVLVPATSAIVGKEVAVGGSAYALSGVAGVVVAIRNEDTGLWVGPTGALQATIAFRKTLVCCAAVDPNHVEWKTVQPYRLGTGTYTLFAQAHGRNGTQSPFDTSTFTVALP